MKKIILTTTAIAMLATGMLAQNRKIGTQASATKIGSTTTTIEKHEHPGSANPNINRCGSQIPSIEWNTNFNALVDRYKEELAAGKSSMVNYTIAVVMHIIHNNEVKGGATSYNLSQAQCNSQVTVLNADYAGTNSDISQCPAAFIPVKAGNTGVTFCLATKNPTGTTLVEPGIDRIDRNTKGWTAPPYTQAYIDATIKPNSIWDPTKYLNIWACNLGGGLLGYATFPANSGLTGIPGGTGTATTDGVVLLGSATGNVGYQSIPAYNKGRSGTHEVGHWIGLRHIWGDANCATDYCNDTPPAEASHFNCISPATPYHVNMCGAGTSPNGEMTMNYMDYTDDACMFMFSGDQKIRMQTCMANGTYRSPLTSNAVTLCSGIAVVIPVAAFNYPVSICKSVATQFTDASTGPPTSWLWSVAPATATITTTTSQNPMITFGNAGNYTVSLTATNSQGSGSISHTMTVGSCTVATTCPDTLRNVKNTDTLTVYTAGSDTATPGCSPNAGYVIGSNCYGDKEKADFYDVSKYNTLTSPQINSVLVLFYKNGTKGTGGAAGTAVSMKIYNGTLAGGPTGAALSTVNSTLGAITAVTPTTSVSYCGNPALVFTTAIIVPYKFTLGTALTPPATNGFFASVTLPGGADTAAILTNRAAASGGTIWEQWSDNSWHSVVVAWGGSLNLNAAILPILNCSIGINANNALASNINLFPNPSTGYFNFAVTLPETTTLNFNVVNTLGQSVFTKTENNVNNTVITYDLSSLGKGVYFVSITDSKNNKTVKKIIID